MRECWIIVYTSDLGKFHGEPMFNREDAAAALAQNYAYTRPVYLLHIRMKP